MEVRANRATDTDRNSDSTSDGDAHRDRDDDSNAAKMHWRLRRHRQVTVDELVTLVNIALGNAEAAACENGVPSSATVDVVLIVQAVNNALRGCSR